jgi:hypothetical protein
MNMKPIEWDKQETFTAPNGAVGIRYAVSDRDGITYEFSMHDPTIQSMLPQAYWLPVFSAPASNAKIDRIDGRLIVLCGLNKPNDPLGNLVLMRVASRPGFSPDRMAYIISLILMTLAGFGIRPDQHMADAIRGN